MSNICKCPKPPGGAIECSDDQLAICGYQNGEIVSGCFARPESIAFISDENDRLLVLSNWSLSVITGVYRSDYEPIEPFFLAVLRNGQYLNEQTGDVVKFSLPRDLDLQSLAKLPTMEIS